MRPQAQDDRLTVGLAGIAILGFAYLALTIAALHLLRTDSDPVRQFMSNYGVGDYSYLANTAFFLLGVAILALAFGLLRGVTPKPTIACALLGVAGVATFVLVAFPIGESESMTASGDIHQLAHAIQIRAIAAASVFLACHFRRDERWRSFRRLALWLAVAVVVSLAVHTTVTQIWPEIKGISQRVLALAVVSWLLLTAFHLRTVATVIVLKPEKKERASQALRSGTPGA